MGMGRNLFDYGIFGIWTNSIIHSFGPKTILKFRKMNNILSGQAYRIGDAIMLTILKGNQLYL